MQYTWACAGVLSRLIRPEFPCFILRSVLPSVIIIVDHQFRHPAVNTNILSGNKTGFFQSKETEPFRLCLPTCPRARQAAAPCSRNISAIHLPIPCAPPVMTATFPSKSDIISLHCCSVGTRGSSLILSLFSKYPDRCLCTLHSPRKFFPSQKLFRHRSCCLLLTFFLSKA